jgi:SOS-response transcriptional repressor LexA
MSAADDKKIRIIEFIGQYRETYGYAPTLRQIAEHSGYESASGVHNAVWALIAEGRLAGAPGRSLHVPDRARADG